jgi:transposase
VRVIEVDAAGLEQKRTITVGKSRRRRINGEAAAMAKALQRDGMLTSKIAEKLGVSFKHAQRLVGSGA